MTTVSIVMAVRNAAPFLPAARRMILAQTLQDFEVVLVDDASNDGSLDLMREWAAEDPRVTLLVAETAQGVAASRNQAVAATKGDYLWFTDCDDTWTPQLLERLVGAARDRKADLVLSRAMAERPGGTHRHWIGAPLTARVESKSDAVRLLLRGEVQGHLWNKLFRRELFKDIRFPLTRAFSDLATMGDLLVAADRVALVDEAFYTYVVRPGSILNSRTGRARDLLDCRDRVVAAVGTVPRSTELDDDLLRFEFREIIISALHDAVRREPTDEDALAVQAEVRAQITLSAVLRLLRIGEVKLAIPAALLRWAPRPYAAGYRLFRRRKWGSVGYF